MSKEICSGTSPWKCSAELAGMALSIHKYGINIAGLSEQAIRDVYSRIQSNTWKTLAPELQSQILSETYKITLQAE